MGGSTEDPAQDVTCSTSAILPDAGMEAGGLRIHSLHSRYQHRNFSGRTVKWQGVPERRCALGRIPVKAKTKCSRPGSRLGRLRGPQTDAADRGVFRRDGKGSRRRYGHKLYTGCIRPPSVRANPIAELFSFVSDDLIYRSFEGAFSRSATRLRSSDSSASTDADHRCGKGSSSKDR